MQQHRIRALLLVPAILLASIVLPTGGALAASLNSSLQSASQTYGAEKPLSLGTVVQLSGKDGVVVPASYDESSKVLGVVVGASAAPVTLTGDSVSNRTYVVTGGSYQVLVSDVNGPIKKGDYIGVSPITGIAMKADMVESTILGRADADYTGKQQVVSRLNVKTQGGKSIAATIGSIAVSINIAHNPTKTLNSEGVPTFVQRTVRPLVGHDISSSQLYGSLAIVLTAIAVVAGLVYGGIRNGMIAIGRNPLARHTIFRNMEQVIVVGLLIFIGSLIGVYLILKL